MSRLLSAADTRTRTGWARLSAVGEVNSFIPQATHN